MRTRAPDRTGTALCLGLVLTHLIGEGGAVRVLCRPGQPVSLPCSYHYEDHARVSQLSVQWRSPGDQLLCHYIKHKAYRNCSAGYAVAYRPGSITLTIRSVGAQDFGTHVCSVSKPHEFSDFSVELARMSDPVTLAPNGGNRSGPTWINLLTLVVCMKRLRE
ncbi:hyaluronan and proteoglycan link protein 4-like isoform X2 [Gasterosteus aculeatus]